jgi:hypothetical protein
MKKVYIILIALFYVSSLYASKSIEIDLSKQKIYAKENGRVVFSGNVSTGKKGHATPRGTFRILEKERYHVSNKYPEPNGGAKMPYMHRLTNKGVAIHQGYLPGYPASHGCIRVSKSIAKKLWRWSKIGMKVKIYGNASNFKYVKKKRVKKRRVAKKRVLKRKKYSKRSLYKSTPKRYVKREYQYQVIELYDSW